MDIETQIMTFQYHDQAELHCQCQCLILKLEGFRGIQDASVFWEQPSWEVEEKTVSLT